MVWRPKEHPKNMMKTKVMVSDCDSKNLVVGYALYVRKGLVATLSSMFLVNIRCIRHAVA